MMPELAVELLPFVPIAVLGAVLGLDVVSFPQAMISRPIVAATLSGAMLGFPLRGLVVGVALEFFALESMPFGASRYPEWGSAAVVGGALFALTPDNTPAAMTIATLAALVTAQIGGLSMIALRRWNAQWARRQQAGIARGSGRTVIGLQLAGMTADLIRGGILTFAALAVFAPLRIAILETFTFPGTLSRAVVVSAASAVGLAAVWKVTSTTAGARWWLLGGLVLGFALAGGLW
ncbi:MAG: PTS sugar transporter subunit IIC [Gemmatimonadaceae bacterium]|nr:PTS sugar transporter subunit IIC [Gemmatimonadaceae bacterium]MCW5825002.1 PTS sugar transporter subunit IIC [Gemmatimonadaceae bacterium]